MVLEEMVREGVRVTKKGEPEAERQVVGVDEPPPPAGRREGVMLIV